MTGERDDADPEVAQRAAELAGVLLAVHVPAEAHDAPTLQLIAASEHTTATVVQWLVAVADFHMRELLRRSRPDPVDETARERGRVAERDGADHVLDLIPVGPFPHDATALELTHIATLGWTRSGDDPESLALMRGYLLGRLRAAGVELGQLDHSVLDDLVNELPGPPVQVIGGWLARAYRS